MSKINELYHYGVKGMKWKNHRYATSSDDRPKNTLPRDTGSTISDAEYGVSTVAGRFKRDVRSRATRSTLRDTLGSNKIGKMQKNVDNFARRAAGSSYKGMKDSNYGIFSTVKNIDANVKQRTDKSKLAKALTSRELKRTTKNLRNTAKRTAKKSQSYIKKIRKKRGILGYWNDNVKPQPR